MGVRYFCKENIPAGKIDLESDRYSLEFGLPEEDDRRYLDLLGRFGPPFPPVFVYEEGRFRVALGRQFVRELLTRRTDVPTGLVVEKFEDDQEFLKFLVYMKKETRGFNSVEKALALKKLQETGAGHSRNILCMLDIPRNDKIIRNHLLLAEASARLKSLVVRGALSEQTAFQIFRFPRGEWDRVARFIKDIPLGTKKRNVLLEMIYEITRRDGTGVGALLEQEEVRRLMTMAMDPLHIGQKVYACFEKRRYPYIHRYRERFYRKLKEVDMDRDIQLTLPRDFEKWEFRLVVAFTSARDFQRKVERLRMMGKGRPFRELMDMRT